MSAAHPVNTHVRHARTTWIMSAMPNIPAVSPNLPAIAYVLASLLALVATGVALALVRFAEKLARFTEAVDALRITHGTHCGSIDRLATATRELAQAQHPQELLPVTTLEAFTLDTPGCCRGPLPEAVQAPLVAPTPAVSAEEVAASARRQATRDRVRPDGVTGSPQSH